MGHDALPDLECPGADERRVQRLGDRGLLGRLGHRVDFEFQAANGRHDDCVARCDPGLAMCPGAPAGAVHLDYALGIKHGHGGSRPAEEMIAANGACGEARPGHYRHGNQIEENCGQYR